MKKLPYVFFAAFALQIALNYPQPRTIEDDTITWTSGSLLTKDDFKGKRSLGGTAAATSSGISVKSEDKNGALTFNIKAVFYKSRSFMVDNSPDVLKHEQLHFDITELYARKLREKIARRDFKKIGDVKAAIHNMFDDTFEDCQKEQSHYDLDTDHGINGARQKTWIEEINIQMLELKQYSSTEIEITG